MIKVGGRRIIEAGNVLVPHGEDVSVICSFDESDSVKFNFKFSESPADGDEKELTTGVSIVSDAEQATFDFKNFNSATGHTTGRPIYFADSDAGEKLSIMATVYKYKRAHRIMFQLMLGDIDE
ncbi:Unknown protein sequence [Pseudomonas syringae pv. atrofaciens]|uniref:Uncharacterized protein n=1 Tax=Pseudomonas syringae pv. atrofaciens TaxID=192087 RepID=A0AAD0MYQ7_PSESX|nr:hypothetical protein [Pseudomonas syringae]AVX22792.1 hypothetical protein DA456_04985 [Pseudomonas syringae pv. atrofaciens]KPW11329.1 Unknown protein sequence [Pseudomonas syringae pv. atrofaciens]